eukprot:scpid56271/ scgid11627/ U11/U12 small nuclear ribonucleoprotein 48 kDa protein
MSLSEYVIRERMKKVEELQSIYMVCQSKYTEVLKSLGWSKESCEALSVDKASCSVDSCHTVTKASLEKHEEKCAIRHYGGSSSDVRNSSYSPAYFYQGLQRVVSVFVDAGQLSGICTSAQASNTGSTSTLPVSRSHQTPGGAAGNVTSGVSSSGVSSSGVWSSAAGTAGAGVAGGDHYATLQGTQTWISPGLALSPMETLRKVFGWQLIPHQFWHVDIQPLDHSAVEKWIKSNIPASTLMSTVVDIESQLLNVVMSLLQSPSCSADSTLMQLKPLLGRSGREFVLRLWKFLIALGMSPSLGLATHHVFLVEAATKQQPNPAAQGGSSELHARLAPYMHIPCSLLSSLLTPAQRLALYEHAVEVARDAMRQAEFTAEDLLTAIEEHPGSKVYDEEDRQKAQDLVDLLAQERDYKRRRQSYRAKNVHITKRNAVEIMRDLIAVGMKELVAEDGQEAHQSDNERPTMHRNQQAAQRSTSSPRRHANQDCDDRGDRSRPSQQRHHHHHSGDQRSSAHGQERKSSPSLERREHSSRQRSTAESRRPASRHSSPPSASDYHRHSKQSSRSHHGYDRHHHHHSADDDHSTEYYRRGKRGRHHDDDSDANDSELGRRRRERRGPSNVDDDRGDEREADQQSHHHRHRPDDGVEGTTNVKQEMDDSDNDYTRHKRRKKKKRKKRSRSSSRSDFSIDDAGTAADGPVETRDERAKKLLVKTEDVGAGSDCRGVDTAVSDGGAATAAAAAA